MSNGDLPENANVVRYARPSAIREDGRVDGSVFDCVSPTLACP